MQSTFCISTGKYVVMISMCYMQISPSVCLSVSLYVVG